MKDLQEFFERTTLESLDKMQKQIIEDPMTEETTLGICNIISTIMTAEKGVEIDILDLETENVHFYVRRFADLLFYHIMIRRCHMAIEYGRMILTEPGCCLIKPTERGKAWYEKELLKTSGHK